MNPQQLRTLFVTESLAVGGTERRLVNLARRLVAAGVQCEVALLGADGPLLEELEASGARLHRLDRQHALDPGALLNLTRIANRGGFHSIMGFLHLSSVYACLAGGLARTPVRVASNVGDRSLFEASGGARKRRMMKRLAYSRATRIFTNSQFVAQQDPAIEPYRERVRVIPNGLTDDAFEVPSLPAVGVPGPRMVMVGRISDAKDYPTFLKAHATASGRLQGLRAIVVGDGPGRAELENLAVDLGSRAQVDFAGMVEDPRPFLAGADVVLLTSIRESLPNAVLEAMAQARPVIATRTGGIPELVVDGETGFLHATGDSESMANSVVRLVQEPALAGRMGEAGRVRAREHFHWDRILPQYLQLLSPVDPDLTRA